MQKHSNLRYVSSTWNCFSFFLPGIQSSSLLFFSISSNLRSANDILDIPVQETARQLTLIGMFPSRFRFLPRSDLVEHEMLVAITPLELQGQAWLKKSKEVDAPHVIAAINRSEILTTSNHCHSVLLRLVIGVRFNQVSGWVPAVILSAPPTLRPALLEYFAKVKKKKKKKQRDFIFFTLLPSSWHMSCLRFVIMPAS